MQTLFENLGKFYYVDWLAMITNFLSLYYLGDKKWYGFAIGACAALLWAIFSFMAGSLASVIANIIFIILNIRGLVKWRKANKIASKL
jgi:nicotinamide riboside transporter PnuC